MGIVLEFLFPKRLARLSYFIRELLCEGVVFYLFQDEWGSTPFGIAAIIAMTVYSSLFVILPRIRDIGMQTWWIVLAFIPYVSAFLGVALLFRRTNPAHNPLLHRSPGVSIPARPDAAA
jgi:uncharacterized membrane protein YhaH (DUF805 family)